MNYKGINLKKIDKMARLSMENGLRLHFDSIVLFKNKSFPSAFFLSVIAIEEIGKSWLLMDFLYHSICNGPPDKDHDQKFLKLIYSHRRKQNSFAFNFDSREPTNNFFKSLYEGDQESLKQNSIYVGLKRDGKELDLKSKINNPLNTKRQKAKDQITNVNSSLLDFTLGVIKEVYCVDADSVEEMLNKRLYNKLKKNWPFINKKTKKIIL